MKVKFAAAGLFISLSLSVMAQDKPAGKPAPNASDLSAPKTDLKELMAGDSFTNSIGMVMVKISSTLWAGKFDVTQDEYQKVMGANPSQFVGGRNPVDSVSWNDARSFCAKLTETERKEEMLPTGFAYSLPTQAQWESLASGTTLFGRGHQPERFPNKPGSRRQPRGQQPWTFRHPGQPVAVVSGPGRQAVSRPARRRF